MPAALRFGMRINISSRELRAARCAFTEASRPLLDLWDDVKPVQIAAHTLFTTTADQLAWELEHPEYVHAQAIHLVRELFDAGLALLDIIEHELRAFARRPPALLVARGAALTFMETIASYLSPFAELMRPSLLHAA